MSNSVNVILGTDVQLNYYSVSNPRVIKTCTLDYNVPIYIPIESKIILDGSLYNFTGKGQNVSNYTVQYYDKKLFFEISGGTTIIPDNGLPVKLARSFKFHVDKLFKVTLLIGTCLRDTIKGEEITLTSDKECFILIE